MKMRPETHVAWQANTDVLVRHISHPSHSSNRTTMRLPAILCFVLTATALHAQTVTVTITDSVLLSDVQRLGINAGGRSWWGADQIMKNLIDNPGFEAGEFASLVLADNGATSRSMPMAFWDPAWNNEQYGIGWPEGFWNDADYEFLWGAAKGRSGRVHRFYHASGRMEFDFGSDGPIPQRMSVLRLQRDIPGYYGNTSVVDATTVRPGSPGRQALRLTEGGYVYRFYMDSLWRDGDRSAGKLLIIRGEYICRLWVRARTPGDRLRIRFFREGEGVFLDQTLSPATEWGLFEHRFTVPEGADPLREYSDSEYRPILAFTLEAVGAGAEILVDDVELQSTAHRNPTVFTDNFVNRLKELRPGVLRYWAGQPGASLQSQLAEPFARRTNGYSPRERRAANYCYSLHEFLELCREVEAQPWYVLPPTFSTEELQGLVEYLAAPASQQHPYAMQRSTLGQDAPWTELFERIHLEYGNEMWGSGAGDDPFMGSSVNGGERLAAIAADRFAVIRSSTLYDASILRLHIGGQAGYAGRQRQIEQHSDIHDAVALAPYFGILNTWNDDSEIFLPLFASPFWQIDAGPMRESHEYLAGREMSLYEINFHTTHGESPIAVRNDFVAGAAAALALPLHMLVYARDFGARTQCAFSSLGYSFRLANGDMVRLWGMLRDVEATGRKRPTWLGVELANKAMFGDMLETQHEQPQPGWQQIPINGIDTPISVSEIQSFAFRHDKQHAVLLFNLSLHQTHRLRLKLPSAAAPNATMFSITPNSIHDNNEDSTRIVIDSVHIDDFADGKEFELPPHSLHAVIWNTASLGIDDARHSSLSLEVYAHRNGAALLHVGLTGREPASLVIYDVLGRLVATPAENLYDPGRHVIEWNAPSSGSYIAVLRTASAQLTRVINIVQ
jgi:hypothetical protein